MQNRQFGPNNPHPLSDRKTELVWEGKYDEYGNRREVDTWIETLLALHAAHKDSI